MKTVALAVLALLAQPCAAQEPPKGAVEGDWKGGKYSLFVPPSWTKADGPKHALWFMVIPPGHFSKDYTQLWSRNLGGKPFIAAIVDVGISTDQFSPLIEKLRADYAFDPDSLFMAAYGEGALRVVKFVSESPDVAAAAILAQGMVQTADPRPAGRATPFLLINDVGCTYARIDEARSFVTKLKDMGYEASLTELNDAANRDQWPTAQMGKMAEWAAAQRRFQLEDIHGLAVQAQTPACEPKEWRPLLRAEFERLARALGDAASPGAAKALADGIAKALPDSREVLREIKLQAKPVMFVVKEAKGKKLDPGTLLICESADFEVLDDAVVICSGEVKAGKMHRCVVIAKGGVTVTKDAAALLLFSGGVVKIGTTLEDSTLNAPAGIEAAGKAKGNWYVNSTALKIRVNDASRQFKKLRFPGGK